MNAAPRHPSTKGSHSCAKVATFGLVAPTSAAAPIGTDTMIADHAPQRIEIPAHWRSHILCDHDLSSSPTMSRIIAAKICKECGKNAYRTDMAAITVWHLAKRTTWNTSSGAMPAAPGGGYRSRMAAILADRGNRG